MKQIRLFILFSVFISMNALGQTAGKEVKPTDAESWRTIDEVDYSIQYPNAWDLDKSGQMGMSFMILSKQVNQQDGFRENVNLLIQNLAGMNINLDKFVEVSQEQIKTMITNGNIIESKRVTENGRNFHQVIYTGELGPTQFKFKQYYWVEHEKAYVLTLTCEASQFDIYRETGEKIMNSFRLK